MKPRAVKAVKSVPSNITQYVPLPLSDPGPACIIWSR